MINKIREIVEDEMTREELSFFLGGSRRFGWYRRNSDLDYFILIKPSWNIEQFINIFIKYQIPPFFLPNYTMNISEQYSIFGGLIHLNFMHRIKDWKELRIEHEEIERFLQKNIKRKGEIKKLIEEGVISGRYAYQILRAFI